LDDLIPAGSTVTQYDLIRMFPNDFTLVPVEMAGADLIGWLDYSRSLAGSGNYLLTSDNLHFQEATQRWELNGETMDPDKIYQMVAPQDALDPSLAIGEKVGTLRQALLTQLHLEALR
jgi:2',3'-cyclic-nucleotide 2'-phosphodiesterase (5'-nucleotidase family)